MSKCSWKQCSSDKEGANDDATGDVDGMQLPNIIIHKYIIRTSKWDPKNTMTPCVRVSTRARKINECMCVWNQVVHIWLLFNLPTGVAVGRKALRLFNFKQFTRNI